MQGIPVKNVSSRHWFSALMAVAVHGGAIALIGIHWERSHFTTASSPASQVIPIQLVSFLPSNAANFDEASLAAPPREEAVQPSSSIVTANQRTEDVQEYRYTLPPVYFPASELDVRPRPEAAVLVPFPDVALEETKVEGILVLYINIDGSVDRIEVQESTLSPLLEQAAMGAFMQAKMQPGMRNGKAVHSQMKVLVEFESRNAY